MSFPFGNNPVSITLYDGIPFNNDYTSHPFISHKFTKDGQSLYPVGANIDMFLNAVNEDGDYWFDRYELPNSDGYNFAFGNGLLTSITLEVPSYETDANYMRVSNRAGQKYYYFITNVTQLNAYENGVTVRYDLELDVLATYGETFLAGVKDIPITVERKHDRRYLNDNGTYKMLCCDAVSHEDVTNGLKPLMYSKATDDFMVKYAVGSAVGRTDRDLNKTLWAYVTLAVNDDYITPVIDGRPYPFVVVCIPLLNKLTIRSVTFSGDAIILCGDVLREVMKSDKAISIKISPYAPFPRFSGTYEKNGNNGTMVIANASISGTILNIIAYPNYELNAIGLSPGDNTFYGFYLTNYTTEKYLTIENSYINVPTVIPTTETLRDINYEIKMKSSPITQYVLKTQYSDDDYKIYSELVWCNTPCNNVGLKLNTYTTPFQSDNTFTFFPVLNTNNGIYGNETYNVNKGLSIMTNYSLPISVSALDQFNATQGASYTTGKILQGISGLAGAGIGVAQIASGNVIKGASGVIGGVAGVAGAIGGAIAKDIDLKNTADTVKSLGTSFYHDVCYGTFLPYIMKLEVTPFEKEMLLDYFYDYGYTVQRCCYFNTEVNDNRSASDGYLDTQIINRSVFNYVKTSEDITNKIHGSIPPICKKKISSIFQNGIKLYTMFNFIPYIRNNVFVYGDGIELYDYYDNNKYENAEL